MSDLFGNLHILHGLALGFDVALSPTNLLFCLIGCLIGTIVGVLPGIGPTATVAMLLPATLTLSPVTSLITLAGIYYGAQYGGSTTSILLRIPGDSSSVITCLDGHAMTRAGRAGSALSISAIGSFVAGTVATVYLATLAPFLSKVVLSFGAPEYFMLMSVGLVTSIVLAQGSVIRAFAMILLGILLGTVGTDVNTGEPRFTFGLFPLYEGIPFVALVLGPFGLADIIVNLERRSRLGYAPSIAPVGSLWPTREEARAAAPAIFRGTLVGLVLGPLPGGGALLSSFVAYTVEKRLSRTPERFGQGAVEGVAAPESANNSGAQAAFVPLLTLGIPYNAIMALMAGALLIQGVIPGPRMMEKQPDLFWGVIVSMWIGNVMLLIINLPLIGIWVKFLKIPYKILYPMILIICVFGVYSVNNTTFDVYAAAVFGALGFLLYTWKCEAAPLILAFVLGPMMEEYFRRTLLISHGHLSVFITRPISLVLLIAMIVLLGIVAMPGIRKLRDKAFAE